MKGRWVETRCYSAKAEDAEQGEKLGIPVNYGWTPCTIDLDAVVLYSDNSVGGEVGTSVFFSQGFDAIVECSYEEFKSLMEHPAPSRLQ